MTQAPLTAQHPVNRHCDALAHHLLSLHLGVTQSGPRRAKQTQ
nr:hypothetical protein [Saccharospirillum impatiens]